MMAKINAETVDKISAPIMMYMTNLNSFLDNVRDSSLNFNLSFNSRYYRVYIHHLSYYRQTECRLTTMNWTEYSKTV